MAKRTVKLITLKDLNLKALTKNGKICKNIFFYGRAGKNWQTVNYFYEAYH
jgi:hypothetical protein